MSVPVTLFGRSGCHLCDEARAAIERLRPELPPLELREVDIDRDDALQTRYLERIPVVAVAGAAVSELEFDVAAFRAAVTAAAGGVQTPG